jgi:hypothetical protein
MKMRANINLDADAYELARTYASARGMTLGAAISELLRQAQQIAWSPISTSARLKASRRGYLIKAKTDRTITLGMVKLAAEDELA